MSEGPKRRWFRFSLRTLFVVATIAGVGIGLLVHKYRQAEQQRAAVEMVASYGGSSDTYSSDDSRWAPQWLQHRADRHFFVGIDCVMLGRHFNNPTRKLSDITDNDLAMLADIRSLNCLKIFDVIEFEDRHLPPLRALSNLTSLMLEDTQVTDYGMEIIGQWKRLRLLAVYTDKQSRRITDRGLAAISGLTELEDLCLRGMHITDAASHYLRCFPHLEQLDLSATEITDAALADISQLKKLRELSLSDTRVTNEGMKSIAKLTHLKSLSLCNTAVSDEGMAHLRSLPITKLYAEGSKMTPASAKPIIERDGLVRVPDLVPE